MSVIVAQGTKSGVTSVPSPAGRVPNPDPERFLTFLTEGGSVHTIIVDADHAAADAQQLLDWFEHTRAGVELSASRPTSPLFKTADEVVRFADEAVGIVKRVADALGGSQPAPSTGTGA